MSFTLQVVKLKKGTNWAIKATMNGMSRYRGYHYKQEAEKAMLEWTEYENWAFSREFAHNFDFPEELGIEEA